MGVCTDFLEIVGDSIQTQDYLLEIGLTEMVITLH